MMENAQPKKYRDIFYLGGLDYGQVKGKERKGKERKGKVVK